VNLHLGHVQNGTWNHVAMVYDNLAGTLTGYLNGNRAGSASVTRDTGANTDVNCLIGAPDGNNLGDGTAFDGGMDEARQSRVARSAAWIWASYRNQRPNSTFLVYNERRPPAPLTILVR